MRRLLLLVTMLVTVTTSAQIKDFFKYSTIYGTAIINQPVQDPYGDWFIPRDWTIQPQPIQNQNEYNYNYSKSLLNDEIFRAKVDILKSIVRLLDLNMKIDHPFFTMVLKKTFQLQLT